MKQEGKVRRVSDAVRAAHRRPPGLTSSLWPQMPTLAELLAPLGPVASGLLEKMG